MKKGLIALLVIVAFVAGRVSVEQSEPETKNANKTKEKLSDLKCMPSDFLQIISPSSPYEKVKEMFGVADKIQKNNSTHSTFYFYDLQNAYLSIESKDDKSISVISIQSKGVKPFVKIGSFCPNNFDQTNLFLGKSTFDKLFDSTPDVEVSADKCKSFAFKYSVSGRASSYHSYLYGTFLSDDASKYSSLSDTTKMFEASLGRAILLEPSSQTIDYIVIGDDELIKKNHCFGEGIHCDLVYLH